MIQRNRKDPAWPHSSEAEESVIGAVLLHPKVAAARVAGLLRSEDFHSPALGAVFDSILALTQAQQPLDVVTVTEHMRSAGTVDRLSASGGLEYLIELQTRVVSVENVEYHARLVRSKAQRRQLAQLASRVVAKNLDPDQGDDECLAESQSLALRMLTLRGEETREVKAGEILKVATEEMAERCRKRKEGGMVAGIPTGFQPFEALLGGLRPGELYVFGARPGVGKTALWMAMLINAARAGFPALGYSVEMRGVSLLERALSAQAQVESARIRNGSLDTNAWGAIFKAAGELSSLPLWIDDDGDLTIRDMQARARRWRAEHTDPARPAVIGADYVQLIRGVDPRNRDREVGEVSRGLKSIAKELQVPVIALASLNRESDRRDNKRPRMIDLRESGAIESDADTVGLLYRDEMHNKRTKWPGCCEVSFAKNRHGPTEMVRLRWLKEFTRFEEMQPREPGDDTEDEGDTE